MPADSDRTQGSIAAFVAVALGLSWAAWIPFALSRAGVIAVRVPAELAWLSEYGPSVAAIGLVWWAAGRAGVRRLVSGLGRWRARPRWYLVAIGLTPVAAVLAVGLDALVAGTSYPVAALAGWDGRFVARTAAFAPSLGLITGLVGLMKSGPVATGLVLVTLAITNGGLSEEIGWRGYVLPNLLLRRSPLVASLVVGVLWAFWHTGVGFWETVFTATPTAALRFAASYLGHYLVLVVPLSVVYAWLWLGTGGSLLLIVLLHASYNITITVVTGAWPGFPFGWFLGLLYGMALVVSLGARLWVGPGPAQARSEPGADASSALGAGPP